MGRDSGWSSTSRHAVRRPASTETHLSRSIKQLTKSALKVASMVRLVLDGVGRVSLCCWPILVMPLLVATPVHGITAGTTICWWCRGVRVECGAWLLLFMRHRVPFVSWRGVNRLWGLASCLEGHCGGRLGGGGNVVCSYAACSEVRTRQKVIPHTGSGSAVLQVQAVTQRSFP